MRRREHDPLAVGQITQWDGAWLPALAASRFEHGHRQLPTDRIHRESLNAVHYFPFETHAFIQP